MRRRRLMMLTLLAVALPTAALANTVTLFSITSSQFNNGTFSLPTAIHPTNFQVLVRRTSPSILTIRTLNVTTLSSGCLTSPGFCTFDNGVVNVATNSTMPFTSNIISGTVTRRGDDAIVFAKFAPNAAEGAPSGGFAKWVLELGPSGSVIGGSARVVATPELSTLFSLGTGLVGLAWIIRRKLKLGT